MNITTAYENGRILLIDDNESIHQDFRKILCSGSKDDELAAAEAELFGEGQTKVPAIAYEVTSAMQGCDGLAFVQKAIDQGAPFAVAFVDVRMPPGWDGVETIERIWQVDPHLQVVLCTAFSDHSWQQIIQRLGRSDRLLILKKPFDVVEVQQLALTLTTKWNHARSAQGHQAALEAAVEMRTRQLVKAREAAEAATLAKSQFLINISREIQAPMDAILQVADLLLTQGDISKAPLARVTAINAIIRNGQHLLGQVNNVLDFCRIETGKVQLQRIDFDLHDVVERTVKTFASAATQKKLELSWRVEDAVPRDVVGDPQRLGQILSNLVDNAIKFTETGLVAVQVALEQEQDEVCLVHFSVSDTGIGIEMGQLDCVFHAFSQVDGSSERKLGGAGLGLAICKRLAEMQGGNIGVCSAPNEGSTFSVTLALKRSMLPASRLP